MSSLKNSNSNSNSLKKKTKRKKSSLSITSKNTLIQTVLSECKFGIEFETCFCFKDNPELLGIHSGANEDAMKKLVNILNKDSTCSAKFNFIEDEEEFDKSTSPDKYKVWNIVQDGSISCDTGLNSEDSDFMYYTTKGVKTSKKSNSVIKTCSDKELFYSGELISPVYSFPQGLTELELVYDKCFNTNFIFEVNKSQGLHINISNPVFNGLSLLQKINTLKFLEAWWIFEPILFKLVDISRSTSTSIEYCVPLRTRFKTLEDLRKNWANFYSILTNNNSKYTAVSVKENRFEIRIIQGSADKEFIINWIVFLNYFMTSSIINVIPNTEYKDPRAGFVLMFNHFLPKGDKNIDKLFNYFKPLFRI